MAPWLLAGLTVFLSAFHSALAAQITYVGSVSSLEPVCPVKLGVFNPVFDPCRYKFVYGVDEVGNMNGTMYGKAVAEGNFLPVGQGTYAFPGYGSPGFAGRVTVSGLEGRPLWLFVFGNRDPDCAETLAFCSDSSWLCPPDNGQIPIDASTATTSVFGSFGPGGAIQVSGLPFPEPPVFWLLGFGLVSLIFIRRLTRSRVEKANSYHSLSGLRPADAGYRRDRSAAGC